MKRIGNIKYLLCLPSFYGFISLSFTYFIYNLKILDFNSLSLFTHSIILISIFAFFLSTIIYYRLYKYTLINIYIPKTFFPKTTLFLLYLVGFIGVILYLKEFLDYYGGITNYLLIFFSESSSELRSNSFIASDSIGIQLTYLGWIAIGLNTVYFIQNKISKFWIIPLFTTFLSNLLFIDRTRPMWLIMIIIFIIYVLKVNKFTLKKLISRGFIIITSFLILFIAIGSFAGKTTEDKLYKGWNVSSNTQNIVFYLTSSFFYLDYIIINHNPTYNFDRTIYPALKTLNLIGVINNQPSSLINEFYGSPYQTNVGTFLEPFFNDFGFWYLIFGIFLHSFLLNNIAIFFLKMKTPFSIFVVANICIVDFFAFFTPKINNFPIWLFLLLGYMICFKMLYIRFYNVKKADNILH
jgi:oligosaccharide repeat unit polymerase